VFRHVGFFVFCAARRSEGFDVPAHGGKKMQLLTTAVTYRNRIGFVPKSCPERTRKDRIIEALGAANIPKVHDEPLSRYYKYLTEHLCFPFIAHFPKPATFQEEEEFRCTVVELLDPVKHMGDGIDGIFSKTSKGKYEINVPLIDLYLPEDSFGFQLIDDYWYWFWNWR
jgi:hypothetical protein